MNQLQQIAKLANDGDQKLNRFLVEVQQNMMEHVGNCGKCGNEEEGNECNVCEASGRLYNQAQKLLMNE